MTPTAPTVSRGRLVWVVGFVAAAVLGFEIALMRVLLVASYHHFAFLVITVVLLGFGASGSALFLVRSRVLRRGESIFFAVAIMAAVSIPLCSLIAQHIPIEAKLLPATLWRQIGCWIIFWAILTIPFFLGASVVGLGLMMARQTIAGVYASNLIGSAAGALLAPGVMVLVAPAWLPVVMGAIALIGAAGAPPKLRRSRWGVLVASVVVVGIATTLDPPHIRVDQFKDLAYLERLEAQGAAEQIGEVYGPRGVVTAYRSDLLHDLPFLGLGANPPAITALVVDGHRAGSLLDVAGANEAGVVDHTLMAFPYVLAPAQPRVLLLGETDGVNAWLAVRRNATTIDVVQPDDNLFALLRGPLHTFGGNVLDLPGVRPTAQEPRHFVASTSERFDLIQLVTLESLPAGSSGLSGLGQDHLVTVEGISACLKGLSDKGVLAVSRGIQTPPRDNLKLLATLVEALRHLGVTSPEDHIVVIRDYLGVCTIARTTPWTMGDIARVRRACRDRELTPVWFTGIEADELNQPDQLPSPPDGIGDWYHYAARQLFSPRAGQFIKDWAFDIRPPTDDCPFFRDFCKLRSIGELERAFGDMWLTRAELGFLFVVVATLVVTIIGVVLTILPLGLSPAARVGAGRAATAAYFTAIGLAYLMLEMTFLSRLTHLIGDPVLAAAVTIAGFLLLSGFGSLTAQWVRDRPGSLVGRIVVGVAIIGVLGLIGLRGAPALAGTWPVVGRCLLALVIIAPLAYLMGFPMPLGLRRIDQAAPALVPWAWGVNGFASVLAAPLATFIGMTWGFYIAGVGALFLYLSAGLLFALLPRGLPAST